MSPLIRSLFSACLCASLLALDVAGAGGPKPSPRVDSQGDPLPEGALARYGCVRLRHGGEIYLLSFSADGKKLASFGGDQTLRLWDATTGKELGRFDRKGPMLFFGGGGGKVIRMAPGPGPALRDPRDGGDGQSFTVACSADGSVLAMVDPRNQILVFDTATGKQIRKLELRDPTGHALALSADGKLLACGEAGGEEHTIRLWDLAANKELPQMILGRQRIVSKLVFAPDGKQLAGISGAQVRLWDVTTGKRTRLYEGHDNQILAVAFSGDGQRLATAAADSTVRVWESGSEEELKKFTINDQQFSAVAFSPDGKSLLAGGSTNAVHVWDLASGQEKQLLEGHKAMVVALAVAGDGATIASASVAGEIRLWDAANGKELSQAKQPERVEVFGLHTDGHTIVTWAPGTVRTLDLLTGAEQMSVKAPADEGLMFEASADGKLAAVWNPQEDGLRLWDGQKGEELFKLPGHDGGVMLAAFSRDGKLLATSGGDGAVRVWKVATGKEAFQLPAIGNAGGCAFSPDGKLLALALAEGDLCLVETLTGKERCRLRAGRGGGYSALAFSPDGRLLAQTAGDEVIRVWDVLQGKLLRGLVGHQDAVATLAFSPKGDVLASGSDDGSVRLWRAETGEELRSFEGHQGGVTRVLFTADGKGVVSSGRDGCVLLWDAVVPDKAQAVGNLAVRKFDQLWADLADSDGNKAFQAIGELVGMPKEAVSFLASKLHPVQRADPTTVERWVAELDHKTFAVRQKATRELERLGGHARAALEKALASPASPEAQNRLKGLLDRLDAPASLPDDLRVLRAVEVLERIAGPEARTLLQDLAKGAPGARLTQEAGESVKRLTKLN
jgi:WD40 repeat protein